MKKIKTLLLSLTILLLAACGAKEQVSADRLEEARQTAKANSEFNAMAYKGVVPPARSTTYKRLLPLWLHLWPQGLA